ncbi:MAG: ABC transporter permease [Candidatus Latescibacterota bacterium]|nr:MAG: ABC transporter permease [Candidatus Latescibacterota bacterium]
MRTRRRGGAWSAFGRNVALGIEAFHAHRLRTALTTLGVVFGVGAVVCMLAIGKGAEQRVLAELRRLGVRNLHVQERRAERAGGSSGLVLADARALAKVLAPHVEGSAGERVHEASARVGARRADVAVTGVTPNYAGYLDLELVHGRFISQLDQERAAAVCVLSETLLPQLLPARQALGSVIRIAGHALRVVGVVRGVAIGDDARAQVFLPLSTAWRILPHQRDARELQRIVVRLSADADPSSIGRVVAASLLRRHSGTRDFSVIIPVELIRKEQRTQRIFQLVMGSIAGISLLVGGIGIANIMFASVVERTSEIGVRRAVGARRRDVLTQFLFESGVLGGAGGIVGVLFGILGAFIVTRTAGWPILVTPGSVLLATGMAIATGVVSGFVPAHRAATVNAIEALHHE